MERELKVVGQRLPMVDAAAKVTGAAAFTDDLSFPGMLYGKILRSRLPHAKIVRIDTSRAEKLPGVKGVATGRDIPDRPYGIVPKARDEYALAKEKVRYIGDEVAAVCAIDPEIAEEAVELIHVEYEELPAVFDVFEAIKEGAPLVHESVKNNTSASIRKEFGNAEQGFAKSDYVFEDSFYSQPVNHAPLEPHAAVAKYDQMNGEVTLWSCTQIPFFLRRNLAATLMIPESKVRIVKPKVGGGFGQKIDMFAKDFCAAWFAIRTGKPVKFVYEREEIFIGTRQRHPMYTTVKTGVKKDGSILAQQFNVYADGGAYNSTAPLLVALSCYFLLIPYRVPNLIYEGYHVYTNKPVGGAMRGHGVPQVRFAVERQLDLIAERIDMDPVDLRVKNSIKAGEPHPAKFIINSCGFTDCLNQAAEAINWKDKRGKLPRGRGIGIAGASFPSGVNNMSHISSGAVVHLGQDGAINVLSGAADIGQGAETVIAQMVAEELGASIKDVRVTAADTGITPLDSGTFGSGVTVRAGNAARLAAVEVRAKLFRYVADKLEANPEDLVARDGKIFVEGSPDIGMSFSEALKGYQYADLPMPIVGRASWFPPATEPTTLLKEDGNFSPSYSFMAQAAEVEVNLETGKIRLVKMITAHDCGKAINPMLVEGQLEGSVVGGMGQALYEEVVVENGQVMNANFLDYGFPTFMEMPEITGIEVETNDPIGPFGAKEAGEGTQVAPAPAIVNAIYDAIGVNFDELPVTPGKVLKALSRAEREA